MFRLLIISLSVCCSILCGFVAYVSENSIETPEQPVVEVAKEFDCQALLNEQPIKPTTIKLSGFRPGKYFGTRDWDRDDRWEYLAVPFFPQHIDRLDKNYTAVIVCFDQIENRKQLDEFVEKRTFDSHFSHANQDLPADIHSQLAQKYMSMDFGNCVVLKTGNLVAQQISLGIEVRTVSLSIGAVSLLVALWNLLAFLFSLTKPKSRRALESGPVVNRAGLPANSDDPSGSRNSDGMSLLQHLDDLGV